MRERVQCNHCVCVCVFFISISCSLPRAAHDGQEIDEDVDDVGVEVQSSKDVLLWAQCQLLVA